MGRSRGKEKDGCSGPVLLLVERTRNEGLKMEEFKVGDKVWSKVNSIMEDPYIIIKVLKTVVWVSYENDGGTVTYKNIRKSILTKDETKGAYMKREEKENGRNNKG